MSSQPGRPSTPRRAWPSMAAGELDAAHLRRQIDYVEARLDLADHRVLLLLKCMLAGELPPTVYDQAAEAVLGFRYSMLEPGTDAMSLWTESHQIIAATGEYLTGQLFGDRVFSNDGRTGARHRRAAHARIMVWLADRFRFGFSEWLSNSYLAFDAAALALLIDYASDEQLTTRASMVLDVLLADVALHSFRGEFAPSMGRGNAIPITAPDQAEMAAVWASAFTDEPPEVDVEALTSLFVARESYQVPAAIRQIALEMPTRRVLTSQGLDVGEVPDELRGHPDFPRAAGLELLNFWWGQQAVTTPETVVETVRTVRALRLSRHRTLAPLRRFEKLPDRLLVPTLKTLNPITQGSALHRANVQTVTTANYLLSSTQRYQAGGFGDQQHLWHASLPGGIQVFGTHPGATQLVQETRETTPGPWVGNGINPDIAQHHNILLAQYDLSGRKGMLEGRRQELVHIRFPFVLFDQTRLGPTWVAGRRDEGYIAILGTHPFEQISETEIVQRGTHTGYAVVLGDDEEYTSLAGFLRQIKQYRVRLSGHRLSLTSPYGRFELTWRGDFRVNGRVVDAWYPRYESLAVRAPRNPSRLQINGTRDQLRLDWAELRREASVIEH